MSICIAYTVTRISFNRILVADTKYLDTKKTRRAGSFSENQLHCCRFWRPQLVLRLSAGASVAGASVPSVPSALGWFAV